MNSYASRITHFKGNPREIGFAAGRMRAVALAQVITHYIARLENSKDMKKIAYGCVTVAA